MTLDGSDDPAAAAAEGGAPATDMLLIPNKMVSRGVHYLENLVF